MKLSLATPYDSSTPNILSDTSGSYADYHAVPSTETKVASFNASTGSSISSKINTTYRVFLNASQPAGTYVGQVKYTIAGHNPNTSFSYYMQDFTSAMCETLSGATEKYITLYDKRDGNSYTVAYINGACWMTQNLRITGVVSSTDSNFSTNSSINLCVGDLEGSVYNEPRCHDSGNSTYGVWYNYTAATAGTVTGSSNSTTATEDICPAGWRLPSYNTNKEPGSINSLADNSTVTRDAFNPVYGGYYYNGAPSQTGKGNWWSNTAYSASLRRLLVYNQGSLSVSVSATSSIQPSLGMSSGLYIRCVHL
jgi:uncharacterized protein (TIGR02145 family)